MPKEKEKKPNPKNAGRHDYYTERIQPRLKEIEHWYSLGLTEGQICINLNISRTTFYKYKKDEKDFQEAVKRGVTPLVVEVRSALAKSALGFTYTEKKTYMKNEPSADGIIKKVQYQEITERYSPPNVASCNLLLKNLDKDNWANDPQSLEMRKMELKHKQQVAESSMFFPVESEDVGK